MDREKMFSQWLPKWSPKNTTVNFNKNQWQESTLSAYTSVLKNIVSDLEMNDQHVKNNLFDYIDVREYLVVYRKIIDHDKFRSLQYYPIAKKALKRYLDFLYELKK